MPNAWVSQERIEHFRPLIEEFRSEHPFPKELNTYGSGWKDHDWMTECALNLEISVDYLRKILIGMEWLTPKRRASAPGTGKEIPNVLVGTAGNQFLVLERGRGGFKVIRDYGDNELAASAFVAGYEFAMRNNS